MPWPADTTLIARLRVQGAGPDPLLTQLRVAQLLNRVELRPRGLPPAAILCVRHLRDPLPRALDIQAAEPAAAQGWEQALVGALDQLAARAARPILGASSAEAVLFADRAELLACLARDWQAGQLLNHWWWRPLLRSVDLRRAVLAAWLEAPEYVPAALGHLSAAQVAGWFLGALTEAEVQQLTRAVFERFALQALEAAISSALVDEPLVLEPAAPASAQSAAEQQAQRGARRHVFPTSPPWAERMDEAAGLPVARQLLLGVCVTMLRRPGEIRTRRFADRVRHWYRARITARARQIEQPPAAHAARLLASANPSQRPERPAAGSELPDAGAVADAAPPTPPAALPPALAAPPAALESEPAATPPMQRGAEQARDHEIEFQQAVPMAAEALPDPPEAAPAEAGPTADLEIATEYGGLFYLVNLALHLNLYNDFTSPEEPGLALPIWDFLALLGEQYLGAALCDDPLWSLLALLSGRGAEPPGAQFVAPKEWRVPPDWLAAFSEEQPWRWAADGEWLRVWHPAGFWAIDQPLHDDPIAELSQAIEPYAAAAQPGQLPVPRAAPLERWVDWLAAYARARLMRALDTPPDDLAAFLFAYRARVFVSAVHVDVELDLQALPIAIRLAGLDRDPGWVPAAGRFIRFHFG